MDTRRRLHAARMRLVLGELLALTALLLAGPVLAEPTLQLRVSREPYYVGVPIEVHVHATGFEKEPEPTCQVDPPVNGSLELAGIVPNFSSSIQIINGQMTRSETATFTCQYRFTASSAGSYVLGPFSMAQGAASGLTQRYSVKVQDVPLDPKLALRVLLPEQPVYVGQQTPVTIEWWLDEDLQNKISSYSIRSDLFERDDSFRFIGDVPAQQGGQALDIHTHNGEIRLAAQVETRRKGRRSFIVIKAERTMIPLRAGEFDLGSATVNVEQVTRWRRDLFGGRRPAESRQIFSRDEARKLIVKAPPRAGRPASFSGAVGQGYSLEVAADRSVVQLGDPIELTLTLHGSGNLASAGLPALDADDGLSPQHFRLPEGETTGEIRDDAKVFRISVRVLSDSVREIPELAYSWFDPELGEYQTARSRPIALSVRPAEVITAADVVAGTPSTPSPDPAQTTAEAPEAPVKRGSISLTGADLSIEQDRSTLQRRMRAAPGLQIAAYGSSIAVLLGAVWLRRRADVDPELLRKRKVLKLQSKRIDAARSQPRRQAVSEIAAALREVAALTPDPRDEALEGLLRECDAVIYAPVAEASSPPEPELVARAEAQLEAMGTKLA